MIGTVTMIVTERLTLVSASVEHLTAELQSPEMLGVLLDASVPDDWPPGQYDRGAQEYFHALLKNDENVHHGWYSWYAITRAQPMTVVAAAGFLGPPNEQGEVEIGYSVASAWRNRGYAKEIVSSLVAHALTDERVAKIMAHTTMQNEGSVGVLLRTGFSRTELTNEDGEIQFELERKGNWSTNRHGTQC